LSDATEHEVNTKTFENIAKPVPAKSPLDVAPAAAVVADADGVLTREEIAEHLKISLRTVEEWQRKGIIPFIKVGKIVLFHWPDVVEHLRKNFRVCRRHFSTGGRR
jgi:excisionase family DNA binding protein